MEICRACLFEGELVPMDGKVLDIYNILTNIKLEDTPMICSTCLNGATLCIEFREKCIKSDQTLNELVLNKNEEKPIEMQNDLINNAELDNTYAEVIVEQTIKPKNKSRKRKYKETKIDAKLNCGLCPNISKSKEELTKHLEKHLKDVTCGICKDDLISIPHILGHRMKHLQKEEKICHFCDKKFISAENLEFHYMRVHEMAEKDAPILCKECNKPFPSVSKLQRHSAYHAEMKFVCDHCYKRFTTLKLIRVHIMGQHLTKPLFKCDLCEFTNYYHKGITSHKLRMHTPGRVVCKNCGRYFPNQDKLDKHNCGQVRPFICPTCGITLQNSNRQAINQHLRKHTLLNYKCNQCPSEFKSRPCYLAHLDKHAGTPRFHCDTCKRSFYNQNCLSKHLRTHTGEKPYVCKVCNRGFAGNYNLKVHMKVHGVFNLVHTKNWFDKHNSNII